MNSRRAAELLGARLAIGAVEHAITLEAAITRMPLRPDPVRLEPSCLPLAPDQTFRAPMDRAVPLAQSPVWSFRRLIVPGTDTVDWGGSAALMLAQAGCHGPLVFEIWIAAGRATLYIAASPEEIGVLAGTWAQYAGCAAVPVADPFPRLAGRVRVLADLLSPAGYWCGIAAPLPLSPFAGAFQLAPLLGTDDVLVLQVLYERALGCWQQNAKAILSGAGYQLPDGPTILPKPLDQPFFAVAVRILSSASGLASPLRSVVGSFSSEGRPFRSRSLAEYEAVFGSDGLDWPLGKRLVHAPGNLVAAKELSLFVHVPGSLSTSGVQFDVRSGLPVPARLRSGVLFLGVNCADGVPTDARHPVEAQYHSHLSICGISGKGKSEELKSLVCQLARSGFAVCVIDPHGPLASSLVGLLGDIPPERLAYLNFDDPLTVAYNGFAGIAPEDQGRFTLDFVQSAATLVGTEGYHRLTYFLTNVVYGLCATGENLATFPEFFARTPRGDQWRRQIIARATNEAVRHFWEFEYPRHAEDEFFPLLNRFQPIWMDDRTRRIFSQRENRLDISQAMDGMVLIVKTPASIPAAKIVGGLLIGQYKHAAFHRAGTDRAKNLCFLIIDEFGGRFYTSGSSLAEIFDEATKGGLRLWTVHQQSNQLPDELVKTIAGVDQLCFGLNLPDAKYYAQLFHNKVSPGTLASLGTGECYARIGQDVISFTCPRPLTPDPSVAARIIAESRAKYYVAPASPEPTRQRGSPRVLDSFSEEE